MADVPDWLRNLEDEAVRHGEPKPAEPVTPSRCPVTGRKDCPTDVEQTRRCTAC